MKTLFIVVVTTLLSACATVHTDPPTLTIIDGGVRMPDNQACSIVGDELKACP